MSWTLASIFLRLRRALWRTHNAPSYAPSVPLSPPLILQERSTLSADGLPMPAGAQALPADWPERVRQLHLWARAGQWLRYRDGRIAMAETLLRNGRTGEALEQLLEVWFVDLNGPRNALPPREALLATEQSPLDPAAGATQARVRKQVRRLIAQLELEADELQAIFFAVTRTTYRRYRLPVSPSQAWQAVGLQIID